MTDPAFSSCLRRPTDGSKRMADAREYPSCNRPFPINHRSDKPPLVARSRRPALIDLVQVLLSLNEFVYLE